MPVPPRPQGRHAAARRAIVMALLALSLPAASPAAKKAVMVSSSAAAEHSCPPAEAAQPDSTAAPAATVAALTDLGLALLPPPDRGNAAVSPLGLAVVLGMVHAGTAGAGASELAALLDPVPAAGRSYTHGLPQLLARLDAPGDAVQPLSMAQRLWLDPSVAGAPTAPFAATLARRWHADVAVAPLSDPAAGSDAVNRWARQQTQGRVARLLPPGALTAATRAVVTGVVHFKGRWLQPFSVARTASKLFRRENGVVRSVPTMSGEQAAHAASVDGAVVYELPFAGEAYSMLIALPPPGQPLADFERGLSGPTLADWRARLRPALCAMELPRLHIAAVARSLKPGLQALGVKTVFAAKADFTPMLGSAGTAAALSDVIQAVSMSIDEEGAEASVATAATVTAKSMPPPPRPCVVDRPFVYAIVHRDSGAPLFIGHVVDPSTDTGSP